MINSMTQLPERRNVALVLASGGARGLAHIGVIDELVDRGYKISSIAGTSMGALVGGLYAAGTLDKFREWALSLDKVKVLRMVDFTINSQGFIKGEKVFGTLNRLDIIPELDIEKLTIPFTAISSDIINNKEVVFSKGNLRQAIRASIAIPSIFTPVKFQNGWLVDGGVLNPLPVNRISRTKDDLLIAVDINSLIPYHKPTLPVNKKKKDSINSEKITLLIKKWDEFFNHDHFEKVNKFDVNDLVKIGNVKKPGYINILSHSVQLMQTRLTQYALEQCPPDILINISKNACSSFEFYKTEEMILYGRETCRKAMNKAGL